MKGIENLLSYIDLLSLVSYTRCEYSERKRVVNKNGSLILLSYIESEYSEREGKGRAWITDPFELHREDEFSFLYWT